MITFNQAIGWSWWYFVRRVQSPVIAANYHLGHFDKAIWLLGDGRSGTTWVSDLINWEKSYREMFEPFHPNYVRRMKGMALHQYIRPDDCRHWLRSRAADVFSGKLRNDRVDHPNRGWSYRGLLIKDIFANLLACWASRRFPHLKIVLLIRNPFAVALSKWKTRHWHWMKEPREFLTQAALCEDYLRPFADLIETCGDDFVVKQVLIWSVLHYVPLMQFRSGQIHILFYENAIQYPEQELGRLFEFLEVDSVDRMLAGAMRILNRPSRVAHKKKPEGEKWPIARWKSELSSEQIAQGMQILARFGLDRLYDADSRPTGEIPWGNRIERGSVAEHGPEASSGPRAEAVARPAASR